VDTMANWNFAGTARPIVLGTHWNFSAGIDGDLYKPRIYDYELSQEEVSAKYLEGAQAIQFQTDWGFQVSPAAEGGVLHQQIGTRSSPFRAGDATFRGVIETDTVNGRLCKVLTCTVAGRSYLSTELFFDTTPTEAAFGTWEFGWYRDAAVGGNTMFHFVQSYPVWDNAANDGYVLYHQSGGNTLVLARIDNGAIVGVIDTYGGVAVATHYRHRITRSSAGVFNVYILGGAFATWTLIMTGTDTTYTVSNYMGFLQQIGDKGHLGNISGDDGIVKRLGVVAP